MQLSTRSRLWIISGHRAVKFQCPLPPKSRHSGARLECPLVSEADILICLGSPNGRVSNDRGRTVHVHFTPKCGHSSARSACPLWAKRLSHRPCCSDFAILGVFRVFADFILPPVAQPILGYLVAFITQLLHEV